MRVLDSLSVFSDDPEAKGEGSTESFEDGKNREGLKTFQQVALFRFSECGSLAKVARELDVSVYELTKLARTDWWKQELANLQREEAAVTNAKMTRLLNTTLEKLEDRLENGDTIFTAQGEMVQKPVPASDLARIYSTVFDKRQLLRGAPTSIDGTNEKLEALTAKLRALGAREPIVIEAEDDGTETH